jgi:UV DNA damage endonuclease
MLNWNLVFVKIGYPAINNSVGCTSSRTFRLKSYSEPRLIETVKENLACLRKTLEFNVQHQLLFFRIASGIVPFASHPINTFDWQTHFRAEFEAIGKYITRNGFRISVHPDQFTLINSISEEIFERSKRELRYHAELLDALKLDVSAKIQIHVGGAYGDKPKSMAHFVHRFAELDSAVKRRLVVENDERLYDVGDCLEISSQIGIPVLFDAFHHKLNHKAEISRDFFAAINKTWNPSVDGVPMVDYSSQKPDGKVGQHTDNIDLADFEAFLKSTQPFDFDIMLEIKDKEVSALKALEIVQKDQRSKQPISCGV